LIYTSEESYDLVEDTGLFEDENITVVDIDGFVDSDKAEILARQTNERMKQEDEKTKKETEKKIFKTDVLNLRIRWGNALSQKINKEKNKSGIFSFCPLSSGEKGNSILIAAGGVVILIDAGLDKNELCKRIVSIGFSPNELFGIVIRHESFRNIQSAGYLSMAYNIPIFITPATLKACPDIHNFVKSPLLKELNCDTRYWIQDLAIEPFSISHVACDPIGLTLSWQNWKIGIAIDLGIVTNIVPQRLANCSLLYLESNYDQDLLNNSPYTNEEKQLIKSPIGHLSNTEAGLLLSQIVHKGLKYVILANINVQTNRPELALKAANESLKNSKAILSVVKPDGPIEKVNLVTEKVNLVKKESSEIIKSSIKKRNSLWSKATMWAKKRTRRGNARQQTDQQLK
jgi:phosphoribosyl 1,2-cyclic phosphodiesterase